MYKFSIGKLLKMSKMNIYNRLWAVTANRVLWVFCTVSHIPVVYLEGTYRTYGFLSTLKTKCALYIGVSGY